MLRVKALPSPSRASAATLDDAPRRRALARPRRASSGAERGRAFVDFQRWTSRPARSTTGQEPDPATGAIITPIYQTSTYVQDAVGEHKGYDYSRVANPTRTALQDGARVASRAPTHGIAFSSGLGATTTLMHLVDPGERVVLIADVYGGVYRMTSQVYEPKGYRFDVRPGRRVRRRTSRAHLDDDTRIVWIETPSNPLLNVVDIRAAADAAHAVGAMLVVDNTFATPYLQQPLELGADVVVHSTTKYLGGHSRHGRRLRRDERPDDRRAPLLPAEVARRRARPVRLLARPARDQDARRPHAPALRERAADRRVPRAATTPSSACSTPACRRIPSHDARARGRCATSAAWSRSSPQSEEEAVALVARTKLFQLAESLGGVESLIEHPARMTHASTADAPFAAPPNLVRLSVGIESVDDLIADLEHALVPAAVRA